MFSGIMGFPSSSNIIESLPNLISLEVIIPCPSNIDFCSYIVKFSMYGLFKFPESVTLSNLRTPGSHSSSASLEDSVICWYYGFSGLSS